MVLWGGVLACSAAPIFKRNPVVVIGGGDSAMEEATYLTKSVTGSRVGGRTFPLGWSAAVASAAVPPALLSRGPASPPPLSLYWNARAPVPPAPPAPPHTRSSPSSSRTPHVRGWTSPIYLRGFAVCRRLLSSAIVCHCRWLLPSAILLWSSAVVVCCCCLLLSSAGC
jgi:hypothetical protein